MSTIVRTPAVVLRTMKYRETSRIVTFYTREHGKMSGIVKGARQPKSKYGASLEPMSYVMLIYYRKEGRELQTVSACDILRPLRSLTENLEKMSVGLTSIELVSVIAHEEEKNIPLFNLLVNSLTALNDAAANFTSILLCFEVRLAAILGFTPSFERCLNCRRDVMPDAAGEIQFHLTRGGILCEHCGHVPGQKMKLGRGSLEKLISLQHFSAPVEAEALAPGSSERREMESLLWNYLRYHVSGMRALKSEKVFSKILAGS